MKLIIQFIYIVLALLCFDGQISAATINPVAPLGAQIVQPVTARIVAPVAPFAAVTAGYVPPVAPITAGYVAPVPPVFAGYVPPVAPITAGYVAPVPPLAAGYVPPVAPVASMSASSSAAAYGILSGSDSKLLSTSAQPTVDVGLFYRGPSRLIARQPAIIKPGQSLASQFAGISIEAIVRNGSVSTTGDPALSSVFVYLTRNPLYGMPDTAFENADKMLWSLETVYVGEYSLRGKVKGDSIPLKFEDSLVVNFDNEPAICGPALLVFRFDPLGTSSIKNATNHTIALNVTVDCTDIKPKTKRFVEVIPDLQAGGHRAAVLIYSGGKLKKSLVYMGFPDDVWGDLMAIGQPNHIAYIARMRLLAGRERRLSISTDSCLFEKTAQNMDSTNLAQLADALELAYNTLMGITNAATSNVAQAAGRRQKRQSPGQINVGVRPGPLLDGLARQQPNPVFTGQPITPVTVPSSLNPTLLSDIDKIANTVKNNINWQASSSNIGLLSSSIPKEFRVVIRFLRLVADNDQRLNEVLFQTLDTNTAKQLIRVAKTIALITKNAKVFAKLMGGDPTLCFGQLAPKMSAFIIGVHQLMTSMRFPVKDVAPSDAGATNDAGVGKALCFVVKNVYPIRNDLLTLTDGLDQWHQLLGFDIFSKMAFNWQMQSLVNTSSFFGGTSFGMQLPQMNYNFQQGTAMNTQQNEASWTMPSIATAFSNFALPNINLNLRKRRQSVSVGAAMPALNFNLGSFSSGSVPGSSPTFGAKAPEVSVSMPGLSVSVPGMSMSAPGMSMSAPGGSMSAGSATGPLGTFGANMPGVAMSMPAFPGASGNAIGAPQKQTQSGMAGQSLGSISSSATSCSFNMDTMELATFPFPIFWLVRNGKIYQGVRSPLADASSQKVNWRSVASLDCSEFCDAADDWDIAYDPVIDFDELADDTTNDDMNAPLATGGRSNNKQSYARASTGSDSMASLIRDVSGSSSGSSNRVRPTTKPTNVTPKPTMANRQPQPTQATSSGAGEVEDVDIFGDNYYDQTTDLNEQGQQGWFGQNVGTNFGNDNNANIQYQYQLYYRNNYYYQNPDASNFGGNQGTTQRPAQVNYVNRQRPSMQQQLYNYYSGGGGFGTSYLPSFSQSYYGSGYGQNNYYYSGSMSQAGWTTQSPYYGSSSGYNNYWNSGSTSNQGGLRNQGSFSGINNLGSGNGQQIDWNTLYRQFGGQSNYGNNNAYGTNSPGGSLGATPPTSIWNQGQNNISSIFGSLNLGNWAWNGSSSSGSGQQTDSWDTLYRLFGGNNYGTTNRGGPAGATPPTSIGNQGQFSGGNSGNIGWNNNQGSDSGNGNTNGQLIDSLDTLYRLFGSQLNYSGSYNSYGTSSAGRATGVTPIFANNLGSSSRTGSSAKTTPSTSNSVLSTIRAGPSLAPSTPTPSSNRVASSNRAMSSAVTPTPATKSTTKADFSSSSTNANSDRGSSGVGGNSNSNSPNLGNSVNVGSNSINALKNSTTPGGSSSNNNVNNGNDRSNSNGNSNSNSPNLGNSGSSSSNALNSGRGSSNLGGNVNSTPTPSTSTPATKTSVKAVSFTSSSNANSGRGSSNLGGNVNSTPTPATSTSAAKSTVKAESSTSSSNSNSGRGTSNLGGNSNSNSPNLGNSVNVGSNSINALKNSTTSGGSSSNNNVNNGNDRSNSNGNINSNSPNLGNSVNVGSSSSNALNSGRGSSNLGGNVNSTPTPATSTPAGKSTVKTDSSTSSSNSNSGRGSSGLGGNSNSNSPNLGNSVNVGSSSINALKNSTTSGGSSSNNNVNNGNDRSNSNGNINSNSPNLGNSVNVGSSSSNAINSGRGSSGLGGNVNSTPTPATSTPATKSTIRAESSPSSTKASSGRGSSGLGGNVNSTPTPATSTPAAAKSTVKAESSTSSSNSNSGRGSSGLGGNSNSNSPNLGNSVNVGSSSSNALNSGRGSSNLGGNVNSTPTPSTSAPATKTSVKAESSTSSSNANSGRGSSGLGGNINSNSPNLGNSVNVGSSSSNALNSGRGSSNLGGNVNSTPTPATSTLATKSTLKAESSPSSTKASSGRGSSGLGGNNDNSNSANLGSSSSNAINSGRGSSGLGGNVNSTPTPATSTPAAAKSTVKAESSTSSSNSNSGRGSSGLGGNSNSNSPNLGNSVNVGSSSSNALKNATSSGSSGNNNGNNADGKTSTKPTTTTAAAVTCPAPPTVDGAGCENCPTETGRAIVFFNVGDQVRYTCRSGYKLTGNALITCQRNGIWSTAPTCVLSTTTTTTTKPTTTTTSTKATTTTTSTKPTTTNSNNPNLGNSVNVDSNSINALKNSSTNTTTQATTAKTTAKATGNSRTRG